MVDLFKMAETPLGLGEKTFILHGVDVSDDDLTTMLSMHLTNVYFL